MWLGYSRVSRVGDRADRLISPDLQRDRIAAWAQGREVEMLPPELDVSGGVAERPILSEAIRRVEAGEAEGIVVAQLDRLSRMGIVDTHKIIKRIEDAGGKVVAVAEAFDDTTPEGAMGRNVMLALGEMQLARYKAQFSAAKEQAVLRGIWPLPVVPLGYVKGEDRRLHPGPDAALVKQAFEARAAGESFRAIGERIDRGRSGAARVIGNRVYLGEIHYGPFVNTEAHEPIVGRALWEAAQRFHPRPPRGKVGEALLGGLIRCAGCRTLMSPQADAYRCQQTSVIRCPAPAWISRPLVEGVVERAVLAHLEGLRGVGKAVADSSADDALAAAEAELAAFQRTTEAAGDPEHFTAGLRQRVEAVERARREVARAYAAVEADQLVEAVALWPELSVAERRHVLRGSLGVVWVWRGRGPDRIKVVAAGFEPDDLPRPGWGRHSPTPVEFVELPGEIRLASTHDLGEGSSGA